MNKAVVITGASSGIGAATARLLSSRGDAVMLVARRADALAAVAAACGDRARSVSCDVTNREQVRRVVAESIHQFGRIDVWINNAGQGITRQPSELTDEDIDAMIQSNVKSAIYGMQEVLPHFKARGEGHIINISSMLGRIPFATFRSAYSASKHFLNAMTAMFRDELKQTHPNIQVSLVSPGVVGTEFGLHAMHGGPDSRQLPGAQPVEEVAAVLLRVIESRQPDVYTRAGSREMVLKYVDATGADPT